MAKGLRAKTKKRNRAIMRATVGKVFQEKLNKQLTEARKARLAKKGGTASANLMLASAQLGGCPSAAPLTQSDDEGGDDDDAPAQPPAATGALNMVPRRVAARGTRAQRKFSIPVVKRDADGKVVSGKRIRSARPGESVRVSGGKPKTMVAF